jgi:hypothetical protein
MKETQLKRILSALLKWQVIIPVGQLLQYLCKQPVRTKLLKSSNTVYVCERNA